MSRNFKPASLFNSVCVCGSVARQFCFEMYGVFLSWISAVLLRLAVSLRYSVVTCPSSWGYSVPCCALLQLYPLNKRKLYTASVCANETGYLGTLLA